MKRLLFRSVAAVCALMSVLAADACTAIAAGRRASGTGHVLVGHNEDGSGFVIRFAMLPRSEGKAAIFWVEAKKIAGGDRVAACFYNEYGVFVTSNNGGVMTTWDGERFALPDEGRSSSLTDGGIGHFPRTQVKGLQIPRL